MAATFEILATPGTNRCFEKSTEILILDMEVAEDRDFFFLIRASSAGVV